MKKFPAKQHIWVYAVCVLLAVALKQHYSTADSGGLRWILAPTAGFVSLLTGVDFAFEEGEGFVGTGGAIVIAPACAGVNFLIICFCTLVFSHNHRLRGRAAKSALLLTAGFLAFFVTVAVNAGRIVLAMRAPGVSPTIDWLTPDRLHRIEGICVYFLALSLLHCVSGYAVSRIAVGRHGRGMNDTNGSIRSFPLLVPLFWYVAVTLGVPLLRGSFRDDLRSFVEHSTFVVLIPVIIMLAVYAGRHVLHGLIAIPGMKRGAVAAFCLLIVCVFCAWDPGPVTETCFDSGQNGLWIGSKWYTGFDNRYNRRVLSGDIDALADLLAENRIRYAYVRAGRITLTGEISLMPDRVFFEMEGRAPDVVFLPWFSGTADELRFQDRDWVDRMLQSMGRLYASGVRGVHLDIEPIRDNQAGYVELLQEIRNRFEGDFLVSHATRRVAPVSVSGDWMGDYAWSKEFYLETMRASDQTVLMGYNTRLCSERVYMAYMKQQTRLLLDWASEVPGHGVLIGIPAYEHAPRLSNPRVENISNAALGVRAALESRTVVPACFEGVSVYANWSTSPEEWQQFRNHWLINSSGFADASPAGSGGSLPLCLRSRKCYGAGMP